MTPRELVDEINSLHDSLRTFEDRIHWMQMAVADTGYVSILDEIHVVASATSRSDIARDVRRLISDHDDYLYKLRLLQEAVNGMSQCRSALSVLLTRDFGVEEGA